MRWFVIACLLLPIASAQTLMPEGRLSIDEVHAPDQVEAEVPFEVVVDAFYSCTEVDGLDGDLEVHIEAEAYRREQGSEVPLDASSVQLVDMRDCVQRPDGMIEFSVSISGMLSPYDEEDVLDLNVSMFAEVGEGVTHRQTDVVEASKSIAMAVYEDEPDVEPVDAEPVDDQYVPGPALPLLGLALLVLARRR